MPVAFERAFLPYDGSDAAAVALEYAINLAHRGAQLTIVNVVDWTPAYSQAGMVRYVGDSTTQLDALDSEGRLELDTAELRCTEADVYAIKQLIHDQPVPGIVNAAEDMRADLIIMGTHAREGLARAWAWKHDERCLTVVRRASTSRARRHPRKGCNTILPPRHCRDR